jgi:serine/threonine protein kinase
VSCGQISNLKFYAAEIVLVFEHLHSMGVLYRDLKPENILVQRDGHLVLTDFGFAKRSHETTAKTFCGTLAYMSPEMVKLDGPYGKAVDWYSLGVLIFEMITGNTPFRAPNPRICRARFWLESTQFQSLFLFLLPTSSRSF